MRGMRKICLPLDLWLGWVLLALSLSPSALAGTEPKLEPVAFLTQSEWLAKLPDRPDGKTIAIRARFAWAENQRVIRVSNQFIVDGKPTPYIEGIYYWNPGSGKIEFVWSDAEGNLSRGSVRASEGKLVHDFDVTNSSGKVDAYVGRVTRNSDGSWNNDILQQVEGKLVPRVQVRYQPVSAGVPK